MQNRNHIELLKKIGKVEAPPFLLTRIHAKIRATEVEKMPSAWAWAGSLALVLVLFLNGLALHCSSTPMPSNSLAEQFRLTQTHQLYADPD